MFPPWIMPVPRFTKKAFPMQTVQVKISVEHADPLDWQGEVESTLGSQDLKLVGRMRRKKKATQNLSQPDNAHGGMEGDPPREECPLFRDDVYCTWMRAQETACVRGNSDESPGKYDDIFKAIESRNNMLLKELTREGLSMIDPECRDSIGNTPLIAAVQTNNKKIVKLLLKHGVDFDATNKHGNAALHFAAEYQLVSTTKYLLKKGASREIKNCLGVLPGERVASNAET